MNIFSRQTKTKLYSFFILKWMCFSSSDLKMKAKICRNILIIFLQWASPCFLCFNFLCYVYCRLHKNSYSLVIVPQTFLKVHLLKFPRWSTCYHWFILVLSVFKTLAVLSKCKVINLANSSLQTIQMIMVSFGLTKLY